MPSPRLLRALLLATGLVFTGCEKESVRHALTPDQEERAAEILDWTTQGAVGRSGQLVIKFRSDWAADDEVGKDADGDWLDVSPGLKGRLWWKDTRTLVFDPSEDLEPGTIYQGLLDLPGLTGDESLPVYPFSFAAASRTATLIPTAWTSDDKGASATLSVTFSEPPSDTSEAAKVEVSQDGDDLEAIWTWTGPAAAKIQIPLVRFGEGKVTVVLPQRDGGVDEPVELELSVPAKAGEMVPVWVEPYTDNGREGFRVLLSKAPENSSDLEGFLEVGGVEGGLRHELDGQTARISWPERGKDATLSVNVAGSEALRFPYAFRGRKPEVRWTESGAILTTQAQDRIHFQSVNLERVRVRVSRVSPENVPEFLEDNSLADAREGRRRPGRVVWDRVLSLQARADDPLEGSLDLGKILGSQGAGMYTIELIRQREGMLYRCEEQDPKPEAAAEGEEENEDEESDDSWSERENPCKASFWNEWWSPVARRNVVVSDIGLMAWREPEGRIVAVAHDLLTASPWKGVQIEAMGPDDRVLASDRTTGEGFAELPGSRSATVVHATATRDGREMHAWLRLREGDARNLSRFDVAGQSRPDGIRLFPWAERGVRRPGDSLFFGCLVRGPDGREMDRLPLRLTLRDPRGRVAATTVLRASPEGMFAWRTATRPEDPTGRWTLAAEAGPASAELAVLVETVRPNRLKIEATAPAIVGEGADAQGRVKLSSHWLSGGSAAGLRAQVQAQLSPAPFAPKGLGEFTFRDPTRALPEEEATESVAWEGALDGEGRAEFSLSAPDASEADGLLQASLRTRVFEPGGQASIDRFSVLLSPYASYAGIHLRTKSSWGWVQTGSTVQIEGVSVTPRGEKVPKARLSVEVWRHPQTWWWEEGENSRGFLSREGVEKVWTGETTSGGTVPFEPKEEGRYAILVRDPSGHMAGEFLNVWSGWGDAPGGAAASPALLTLRAERDTVDPDGKIAISFPSVEGGKALVQVLDGRRILSQEWTKTSATSTSWSAKVPAKTTGAVYVQVTLLQPYPPTTDRPLRMWGVIPVSIVDPASRLVPEIEAPAEIRPQSKVKIRVRERGGKPMRAMLAVVDEGLLDLTRFPTPDPWSAFHGREALRVQGWDMHDLVVGAWGGRTDRLFAVGGSEDARKKAAQAKGNPFPPLVIVKGPFDIPGKGADVELDIPRYTGSVRIMVVAAHDEAFGSAEKAVVVRAPIMALLTVPRALSPSDRAVLPVTVFASKAGRVQVRLKLTGPVAAEGSSEAWAVFDKPGDQVVNFAVRASGGTGPATASVTASSPAGTGSDGQAFEVRHPGAPSTRGTIMEVNDSLAWVVPLASWGLPGTRTTRLELSSTGLMGLNDRIDDLIQYPHGCLEQTLSGLMPQIFLRTLVPWTPENRLKLADANVRAGLARLRQFQTPSGALSLWPGEGQAYPWGTLWAVRGMLAAREAGFEVPATVLDPILAWTAEKARAFRPGSEAVRGDTLEQVTRLDILALAGKPDLAAMNRLREAPLGDLERWTLAAAYATAGRSDVGQKLSRGAGANVSGQRMTDHWLNSPMRDRALLLEAMARSGARPKASEMARQVRGDLRQYQTWYSTQEMGAALWALARLQSSTPAKSSFAARWRIDQGPWKAVKVAGGSARVDLPPDAVGNLEVRIDDRTSAEAFLSRRAVPAPGEEVSPDNGLDLDVVYERADGSRIDPSSLAQGEDFRVVATVRNTSGQSLPNVALVQIFPGGWEIRSESLEGAETPADAPVPSQPWSGTTEPRRVEIRDDRAIHYLDLPYSGVSRVVIGVRAAYAGSYLRPGAHVEALYDATWQASEPTGQSVVEPR
jgi:uncharacterized protein YfaS (alpha-2-macroglobulin family)